MKAGAQGAPPVYKSPYYVNGTGRIAHNTPAFDEYAVSFMLDQANRVREKWNLDIPHVLTTNDVLLHFYPTSYGPNGDITTTNGRFTWTFQFGMMARYEDHDYMILGGTGAKYLQDMEKLAALTNTITRGEAWFLAEKTLATLGFSPKLLLTQETPVVTRASFPRLGKPCLPLPVITVSWNTLTNLTNSGSVQIYISGVKKKSCFTQMAAHARRVFRCRQIILNCWASKRATTCREENRRIGKPR